MFQEPHIAFTEDWSYGLRYVPTLQRFYVEAPPPHTQELSGLEGKATVDNI